MALNTRVKKIEDQLTPPRVMVCLSHYPCESDEDVHQRAQKVLRRSGRPGGHVLIIRLRQWVECPPGRHTHEDDAQLWPRSR